MKFGTFSLNYFGISEKDGPFADPFKRYVLCEMLLFTIQSLSFERCGWALICTHIFVLGRILNEHYEPMADLNIERLPIDINGRNKTAGALEYSVPWTRSL